VGGGAELEQRAGEGAVGRGDGDGEEAGVEAAVGVADVKAAVGGEEGCEVAAHSGERQ
jgi:hypothetical protein